MTTDRNPDATHRIGRALGSAIRAVHEHDGTPPFTGQALDDGASVLLETFLRLVQQPSGQKRFLRAFRDGYENPD